MAEEDFGKESVLDDNTKSPERFGCGDHRLPCDVWVRHICFRKGVKLQVLADAAARWITVCQKAVPTVDPEVLAELRELLAPQPERMELGEQERSK